MLFAKTLLTLGLLCTVVALSAAWRLSAHTEYSVTRTFAQKGPPLRLGPGNSREKYPSVLFEDRILLLKGGRICFRSHRFGGWPVKWDHPPIVYAARAHPSPS